MVKVAQKIQNVSVVNGHGSMSVKPQGLTAEVLRGFIAIAESSIVAVPKLRL